MFGMLGFDKIRLRRLAESLSDIFNVKITSGPFWATDCESEIIIDEDDLKKYSDYYVLALTIHESAHIYFKSKHNPNMPKDYKSAYSLLSNAVEDVRIERLMQQEYIGARKYFKSFYGFMKPRLLEKLQKENLPPYVEFLVNIGIHAHDYTDEYVGKSKKAEEIYKKAYPHMEAAWKSDDSDEALTHIDKVWKMYEALIPPTDKQLAKASEKLKEVLRMIARHATLTKEQMDKKKNMSKAQGGKFVEIGTPSDKDKTDHQMQSGKEAGKSTPTQQTVEADYWKYYDTVRPYVSFFSQRFNAALIDNRYDRIGGTYRRGRLNPRRIYKARMGSTRLFQQKQQVDKKEYQISLLLDISGSMGGNNVELCRYTAVLCAEMLQKIGVHHQIIVFDDEADVIKPFPQVFTNNYRKKLINRIGAFGGTNNSNALNKAVKDEYKGVKHIIINVTDGEVDNDTNDVVRRFLKEDRIIIGVGVGSGMESINKSFPLSVNPADVQDIPRAVADMLGKYLKRRFV